MITSENVKEIFDYDDDTGVFRWKKQIANKAKIGRVAGRKNDQGYIVIRAFKKDYRAHRLAWLYSYGEWPKKEIDHINRVRDDNRLCNLREANRQQQLINCRIMSNNKSGIKGVHFAKKEGKWCAQIKVGQKCFHLGLFDKKIDAAMARLEAEVRCGFTTWNKLSTAFQFVKNHDREALRSLMGDHSVM